MRTIADCRLQIADCGPGSRVPARKSEITNLKSEIPRCRGFTLVELLVAVTVIGILAGMALTAIGYTRAEARVAKTKATIAKLDHIIQKRYESYKTRRVPVDMTGLSPRQAAEVRLAAIRSLMALEMPDRMGDIIESGSVSTPVPLPYNRKMPYPGLAIRFSMLSPDTSMIHATMLYQVVMSDPENAQLFASDEIGDPNGDGYPEFLDGWGRPIYWLRWAPGFTVEAERSSIQYAYSTNAHDPFDSHRADPASFHLIPLIYSAGPDKLFGVNAGKGTKPPDGVQFLPKTMGDVDTFWRLSSRSDYQQIGTPDGNEPSGAMLDNIHNHHIEQR